MRGLQRADSVYRALADVSVWALSPCMQVCAYNVGSRLKGLQWWVGVSDSFFPRVTVSCGRVSHVAEREGHPASIWHE